MILFKYNNIIIIFLKNPNIIRHIYCQAKFDLEVQVNG